ncbi:MAG: hypothetical protein IT208_19690 [Chthonomonadales bacterium]|nr:hypothetical protein [Chthonomonadales bacterium]
MDTVDIAIYFKPDQAMGAHGLVASTMAAVVLERLQRDWLQYVETGTPRGGVYECTRTEGVSNRRWNTRLFLRFDSVAYIA